MPSWRLRENKSLLFSREVDVNIYSHLSVSNNYLFILNTYTILTILIICSFLFLVKETKNFSDLFSGNKASTFTPLDESCWFLGSAVAAPGLSGERSMGRNILWMLRLWSYKEQGTPHNPSPVTAELKSDASLCMCVWSHGCEAPWRPLAFFLFTAFL